MNKELILKTLSLVENIDEDSVILITKDNVTDTYKITDTYEQFTLTSTTRKNTVWEDYGTIEDLKENLVCDAVCSYFEDIEVYKESEKDEVHT